MGSDGTTGHQTWDPGSTTARTLYLNVGTLATYRNIGVDDIDESMIIEQIGGTAGDATIKVSAYGRSNTYEHVSKIEGSFADGNDSLLVKSGVLVPVVINGGGGNDSIVHEGNTACDPTVPTNTCVETVLSGGIGNDYLYAIGHAILNGGDGADILVHTGGLAAQLNGGERQRPALRLLDRRLPQRRRRRHNAADGNDVLTGPAKSYLGGLGDDTFIIDLAGAPVAGQ